MELHLAPGAATTAHDHHDAEVWFILGGRGEVTESDVTYSVEASDIVDLSPLKRHSIRNTSSTEILTFVSLWWDDPQATMQSYARLPQPDARGPSDLLVLDDTDMDLDRSLGRGAGAEVFLRAARARGDRVQLPADLLVGDRRAAAPRELFDALRRDERIALRLEDARLCERCATYRFDPDAEDTGATDATGTISDTGDTCARCEQPTVRRSFERAVFRPDLVREQLAELLDRCDMSPALRSAVAVALRGELPDVAVTAGAGIEGPRFLAWFEQIACQVAAIERAPSAQPILFLDAGDASPRSLRLLAVLAAYLGARAPAAAIIEPRGELERTGGGALGDALAGDAQGWVREVQARLRDHFGCAVPEAGPWSPEARCFYGDIITARTEVAGTFDPASFSVERACRALRRFVEVARHFGRATAPLLAPGLKTRQHLTHMAMELMAVRTFARLSAPILPGLAADLSLALGDEALASAPRIEAAPTWIAPGQRVESLGGAGLESAS